MKRARILTCLTAGTGRPSTETSESATSPKSTACPHFSASFAPKLNPARRLIEEICHEIDGRVYACIQDKIAAVDDFLIELDAVPERVRRLAGWDWIDQAFD